MIWALVFIDANTTIGASYQPHIYISSTQYIGPQNWLWKYCEYFWQHVVIIKWFTHDHQDHDFTIGIHWCQKWDLNSFNTQYIWSQHWLGEYLELNCSWVQMEWYINPIGVRSGIWTCVCTQLTSILTLRILWAE